MPDVVVRENVVTAGRLRFPVREAGPAEGFPVLLVHGFPDCNASFDAQLVALGEQGFRAIAPSLRGYSAGAMAEDGDYFLTTLVGDVIALLDATGARRAHLVGHDWGAAIGWLAVSLYPERFASYTSIAIPPLGGMLKAIPRHPMQARKSWYMFFFQLRGISDRILERNDFAFIEKLWRDWSPGWQWPPETMARVKETFRQPGVSRAALAYYRHLFDWFAPANRQARALVLRPVQVPCLVLHGRIDGCMDARMAADCIRPESFPAGVKFEVVDGAGHFLHQEMPARVNGLLRDFLAGHASL